MVGAKSFGQGATALLVAVAAASCGGSHRTVAHPAVMVGTISTPAPAPTPPLTADVVTAARREARHILAQVALPKGSAGVRQLPPWPPGGIASVPACNPLEVATERWLVPGSPSQLAAFLTSHVPHSMALEVGSPDGEGSFIAFDVKTNANNEVAFTFAPEAKQTGVQVDALVIPHGAICMSSGRPGATVGP